MIKVGVIRGGISDRCEASLNNGAQVISCLRGDSMCNKYKAIDIFVDREGLWHVNGIPISMDQIVKKVDLIINTLQGDYGEDGKVQQLLEQWNIPYTGSGPFVSAVSYNKFLTKQEFEKLGIKTPRHMLFPAYHKDFDEPIDRYSQNKAREVWEKLPPPWVVKPLTGGSSMGVHVCKTFQSLVEAFEEGVNQKVSILVEEFIKGREASVEVINNFRNKNVYTLPPIEIKIPESKLFFDNELKCDDCDYGICPCHFSYAEKEELERLASLIHTGMNLSHYSKSDFIITPRRGIYALEVNTLPEYTEQSLMPKALESVGSNIPEFIDHIIKLTLNKK